MLGFYPLSGGAISTSGLIIPSFTESVSDSITLADSVSEILYAVESSSDSLTFTDDQQNSQSHRAFQVDAISFAGRDSATNEYSSNNIVFETLTILDAESSLLNATDIRSDVILMTEEVFGYGGWDEIPSPNQSWAVIPAVSSTWTQIPSSSKTWTPVLNR